MPSQVLVLKPDVELTFRGPFDRVVTSVLRLRNPTADQVAFKVKTTAPKRYCVRPNSGLLQPGGEIEVSVMLQPSAEPEPTDRSRHKFMVQSLIVPAPGGGDTEEIWRTATPDSLMDSKLRVVLADGGDAASAAGATSPGATSAASAQHTVTRASAAPVSSTPSSAAGFTGHETESLRGLQQELQRLKDENSRLSDQELRLRKLAMRPPAEAGQQGQQMMAGGGGGAAAALARPPAVPPALFLVLALVLGLIVGKFLL